MQSAMALVPMQSPCNLVEGTSVDEAWDAKRPRDNPANKGRKGGGKGELSGSVPNLIRVRKGTRFGFEPHRYLGEEIAIEDGKDIDGRIETSGRVGMEATSQNRARRTAEKETGERKAWTRKDTSRLIQRRWNNGWPCCTSRAK